MRQYDKDAFYIRLDRNFKINKLLSKVYNYKNLPDFDYNTFIKELEICKEFSPKT